MTNNDNCRFKKQRWIRIFICLLPLFLTTSCYGRYSTADFKLIANNPLKTRDGGFNEKTWEGMLKVDSHLNEDLDVLYPDTQDDPNMVIPAITKSIDDGYQAIILPGFTYERAILQPHFFDVYRDTYFLTVDVNKYDDAKKLNALDNMGKYYEIAVDEVKPGFAAAVDVALQIFKKFQENNKTLPIPIVKTENEVIVRMTAIGGMKIAPITNYMIGFNKGLRWFSDYILEKQVWNNNKKLKFEWYPARFNDGFGTNESIKIAQLNTQDALKNDVGVIFNISVPEANTVLKEISSVLKPPWFVGVDVDQSQDRSLAAYKEVIKSSALKDISFAVKKVLGAINYRIKHQGQFEDNNEYSQAGMHSFIWSKTKNVALVPKANQKLLDDFFKENSEKDFKNVLDNLDVSCSEATTLGKICSDLTKKLNNF